MIFIQKISEKTVDIAQEIVITFLTKIKRRKLEIQLEK